MKALPWILVMLLLISCATSKNTDRNTQMDYSGTLAQMQSRMDSLLINMQIQRKEMSEKLSNLKIENRTVFYSLPDSMGKQYPTQISETNVNKEDKETKTTDTELNVTIQQLVKEVYDLRQKLDAAISEREKVKEVSWWDLHKDKIYIAIIILLAGVWAVYQLKKRLNSLTTR